MGEVVSIEDTSTLKLINCVNKQLMQWLIKYNYLPHLTCYLYYYIL